jgi:hypothetical protein
VRFKGTCGKTTAEIGRRKEEMLAAAECKRMEEAIGELGYLEETC